MNLSFEASGERAPMNRRRTTIPLSVGDAAIFHGLLKAWYGNLDGAREVLGINTGTLYHYCKGTKPVPHALLRRLLSRRDHDYTKRVQAVSGRIDRAREKAVERLAIMAQQDRLGVELAERLLVTQPPSLVWTHTGYKDIQKAKPHPKRIAQKRDGGPTADRSLTDPR
jgi:hypothetical protein